MSTGTYSHISHLLEVSKKPFWSLILYTFFHDLIHVYSPGAEADIPQGTKFWCQQNVLWLHSFVASLKKCLWSLILYNFFHDLIQVYSPGAVADSPHGTKLWCQQKGLRAKWNIYVVPVSLSTLFFSTLLLNINLLLEVKYLKLGTFSDFDAVFFVKCINKIISLPTYPYFFWYETGTAFMFHFGLITLPICYKFQRNLFEVWFYTIFFMI